MRRSWTGTSVVCFLVVAATGRLVSPAAADGRAAHPSRIVVKYRPTLDACVDCLLGRGVPLATVTGSDSLDRLHAEFGVRRARPLFGPSDPSGRSRAAAYREKLDAVRARFPKRTARAPGPAPLPDLSGVYTLEITRGSVADAAARFAADPGVEYATLDHEVHLALVPDDPFFASAGTWGQPYPDLWGLHEMDAATAWDTATGAGTVVAVIDTGVKYRHRDLAASMWTNPGEIASNRVDDDGNGFVDDVYGWDFTRNRSKPLDRHGHGTHVAGTVAAVGNNGLGVVGVAWGARVMAVAGLNRFGNGFDSELAQAIAYAAENGADVLNNSWGYYGDSPVVNDAIATAAGLGAVLVFAAGNDGIDVAHLGGAIARPEVITVAATAPGTTRAAFSSFGDVVSVSAPGVDILSVRGGARARGPLVRGYRRLSGTSMAAPHVAGLAAVLLSALPGLGLDDVRWHLELNADQPGAPGYEGRRWNPFFGFGRVNAGRVFDPPPATARVRTRPISVHAIEGTLTPDLARLDFSFTTHDVVAWTVASPPWLVPDVSSGSGAASIPLALDTTGLAVGPHAGTVSVVAPATEGGGDGVAASVEVHRDERVGDEVLVVDDVAPLTFRPRGDLEGGDEGMPGVASDGSGTLIVWAETRPDGWQNLVAARLDASGALSPATVVAAGNTNKDPAVMAVASDGENFLVVWREVVYPADGQQHEWVRAVRVGPSGIPLDPAPQTVADQLRGVDALFHHVRAVFDGTAYTVLFGERLGLSGSFNRVYLCRIATDGTLVSVPRVAFNNAGSPRIACVSDGGCLAVWMRSVGEVDAEGRVVQNLYGVRLEGDQMLDNPPLRLLDGVGGGVDALGGDFTLDWAYGFLHGIASDGDGYLLLTGRHRCLNGSCALYGSYNDVVAVRATRDAVVLDSVPIRIDNVPDGDGLVLPRGLTFDGESYVATFIDLTQPKAYGQPLPRGFPIFATRISPAGNVLDDEPTGLLLHAGRTALTGTIVSAGTHSVLVWRDTRQFSPAEGRWGSIYARRVLSH